MTRVDPQHEPDGDYLCQEILPSLDVGLPIICMPISRLFKLRQVKHDVPHGLWVVGNENHLDLAPFIKGNTKFIIKPYPYIREYDPRAVIVYPDKYLTWVNDRPFLRNDEYHPNIINIPLGPLPHVINYLRDDNEVVERTIPYGLYGQANFIRREIIKCFPSEVVTSHMYTEYGCYRDVEPYVRFLKQSKVSLCISGHSPETYRFAEAIMCKSLVSSTPLPYTTYYEETTHPVMMLTPNKFSLHFDPKHVHFSPQDKWAAKWLDPVQLKQYIYDRVKLL